MVQISLALTYLVKGQILRYTVWYSSWRDDHGFETGCGRKKGAAAGIMTMLAALKAVRVRSRPEGGLHGHDPRQGPTFFAAKAVVSKPWSRAKESIMSL